MNILHQQLLNALRDAGDEGVTESDIAILGGRWWRQRLYELRKTGHVIGETGGVFLLVVEREVERAGDTEDSSPSAASERCAVAGSLSPEPLVLFPSGSSHYTMDEAA
jgi:hypothetical protein